MACFEFEELQKSFSACLGKEKATELLDSTLNELKMGGKTSFTGPEVLELCKYLEGHGGLVSVVAKLLVSKVHLRELSG